MLMATPLAVTTVHSVARYGLQSTSQCAATTEERASSLRSPHTGYHSLCLPFRRLGFSISEGREALVPQDLVGSE